MQLFAQRVVFIEKEPKSRIGDALPSNTGPSGDRGRESTAVPNWRAACTLSSRPSPSWAGGVGAGEREALFADRRSVGGGQEVAAGVEPMASVGQHEKLSRDQFTDCWQVAAVDHRRIGHWLVTRWSFIQKESHPQLRPRHQVRD
eukprot:CAMPEP_0174375720 /NCGR_PEP_ID=MMETSP0811_2-20130205/115627_1 /TAXON_ID=73025 ORGANISM="Eutreptiella gymnastica-like, Strain CCMP1594" /NCGR_SAMPLE_ID=MMETSP0811_2 /ASSEMBLY_ACC=CAM_ASM_000667 /LENGTH=144 /DNA_ID=CAMNT_0015526243 /DNA_START=296 /DNA_END=731 /DNA_ORIENTATION=+